MGVLSILLTGCWDLQESERLGLVTVIGIDCANDNQIKLSVQELTNQKRTSSSQQGGSTSMSVKTHEAVAPTISEAKEKISALNPHKAYFSHAGGIILSEELVSSKGIATYIDYFERTPEIRRNTWLLISKRGQFNKIMNVNAELGENNDIGKIIKEITANRSSNSYLSVNSLGDFLNLFWETGSEPYTAGITLIENDTEESNQDGKSNSELGIQDTAVFKNDKLAGWFDNTESRGLLFLEGNIKGGILPVSLNNQALSLQIIRINSYVKPVLKDGKMQISVKVNVRSNIRESQINLDFSNNQVRQMIENIQSEEIKKMILAALDKSRQLDSDVFGFGSYIYRKYPKQYKQVKNDWDNYYRKIPVNIDVTSQVRQIGMVRRIEMPDK